MKQCRYTACGGVVVRGDQVLAMLRPSRSEVRLPKGHVETDESHEHAALREVAEETGYSELVAVADLGKQKVEFDHDGRHFVRTEHYYLMRLRNPEQKPSSEGEPEFDPVWLSWTEAMEKLSFRAEREWVRRALEHINMLEHNAG